MPRLGKTENTPKKHPHESEDDTIGSRGEATTKSGRKVKRPAHLDSPERSPGSPVPEGKKTTSRKVKGALEAVDTPVKASPAGRALAKVADKVEDEAVMKSRKATGSARKTIASLADTPKKDVTRERADNKLHPDVVDDSGISKSGRKIKVPSKLIDFESEILSSPRKGPPSTNVSGDRKGEPQASAKTPGRSSRSAKKRATTIDDAEPHSTDESAGTRAVRGKSIGTAAAVQESGRSRSRKVAVADETDSDAIASPSGSPTPAAPKTPGRGTKSLAPGKVSESELQKVSSSTVKAARTPGRQTIKTALKMRADSPMVTVSPKVLQNSKTETEAEKVDKYNDELMVGRTPGRPTGRSLMKPHLDSPIVSMGASETGARNGNKSLAPTGSEAASEDEPVKRALGAAKTPARTPGRRATKSVMPNAGVTAQGTVKDDSKTTTSSGTGVEVLSRSGRKLKPKKIFEIEQEESSNKSSGQQQQQQQDNGGKDSPVAVGRKRKLDNVDAPTIQGPSGIGSPRKKLTTDKAIAQTAPEIAMEEPVQKLVLKKPAKPQPESVISNVSIVVTTPAKVASQPAAEAEGGIGAGSVSRSGRKIKVKKMFGFDDGDASDLSVVGVVSAVASPSKGNSNIATKSQKESKPLGLKKSSKSDAQEADTLPPKQSSSSVADVVDKMQEQKIVDQFVTQRGVDDHHSKTQGGAASAAATDEPDRAVQVAVEIPTILRTSCTPVKKARLDVTVKEDLANTPAEVSAGSNTLKEQVGSSSSRSGRKIKPKKFFGDDDNDADASHGAPFGQSPESTKVTNTKEKKLTAADPISEKQQNEEIPPSPHVPIEGETFDAPLVAGTDIQSEPESTVLLLLDLETEPGVDIPEGLFAVDDPVDEANDPTSPLQLSPAEETEPHSTETPMEENVQPGCPDYLDQEGIDVAEYPTHQEQQSNDGDDQNAPGSTIDTDVPGEADCPLPVDGAGKGDHEPQSDAAVSSSCEPTTEGENSSGAQPSSVEEESLKDANTSVVKSAAVEEQTEIITIGSPVGAPVCVIDITADTPLVARSGASAGATAPRTPDAKAGADGSYVDSKCSPDKPPEIIEIADSPATMAFCRQIEEAVRAGTETVAAGGGSASSTPLPMKMAQDEAANMAKAGPVGMLKLREGRKRSLSASAADTTIKRNVTFHSPANCTMLVDAIDERLMKSFQQNVGGEVAKSASKVSGGARKRSLSEHKQTASDDAKPNKISRKVPNFKNIHANHFDRMESIVEFMKRKEQRAKEIVLPTASPGPKLLSRPAAVGTSTTEKKPASEKPFIFKSGGSSIPLFSKATSNAAPSVQQRPQYKGSNIARQVFTVVPRAVAAATAAAAAKGQKPSNPDHTTATANRLQQYQAAFKPKQHASDASSATATTSTQRPVDQLRTKQSKILKGVRTNRRFELQMKHRDNLQQP